MHAKKIVEEAKKLGVENELEIEVGELCDISAEELKEAIESIENWKVYSNRKESKVKCECGYIGRARILDKGHGYCYFGCSECGETGKGLKVLEGGEIKITGVG